MPNGIEEPVQEESDHREISVAEFFEKNKHLLGFENPQKSIITVVKEAVDNSLDACEEDAILPEIQVLVDEIDDKKCRIEIRDNAIGLDRETIPKVFGKLLYGSKFHKLQQSRGQQGIGISASAMYAQLTTGEPVTVYSKQKDEPCHRFVVRIDTEKNEPEILEDEIIEPESDEFPGDKDYFFDHGTSIEMNIEAKYTKGHHSVRNYLKHTAIMNPYARVVLREPDGNKVEFPRVSQELPEKPKEIKPHPHGVEIGRLMKMAHTTDATTINQFLKQDFTRVGRTTAKRILEEASLRDGIKPHSLKRGDAEKLIEAIKKTDIMSPPTDCIAPIGADLLEKGLKKEVNAEFYASTTRTPKVYRGNPFLIETAIAWGGDLEKDGAATVFRYANRVPLLYQKGACAATEAVSQTNWKNYGLKQTGNNVPRGPVVIVVHIASVWVPFTSEAKEAIAQYEEIVKEIKLAVQEVGRSLKKHLKKKRSVKKELKKRQYIKTYIPHIAEALTDILENDEETKNVEKKLKNLLRQERGELEKMEFDPSENKEYDEELANIGRKD